MAGDLEKEIAFLKSENRSLRELADENQILTREICSLRELLMESSNEMEKCKEEFLRMGRERDILLLKVKELGGEKEFFHIIKHEKEEEARGWREGYYMSRNRY